MKGLSDSLELLKLRELGKEDNKHNKNRGQNLKCTAIIKTSKKIVVCCEK